MPNLSRTAAAVAAVAATSFSVAPERAEAQTYQIDCAILLCLSGGWPASVPCTRARAEFIRRITPWPIEPPLQIWRCPMGVAFEVDPSSDRHAAFFRHCDGAHRARPIVSHRADVRLRPCSAARRHAVQRRHSRAPSGRDDAAPHSGLQRRQRRRPTSTSAARSSTSSGRSASSTSRRGNGSMAATTTARGMPASVSAPTAPRATTAGTGLTCRRSPPPMSVWNATATRARASTTVRFSSTGEIMREITDTSR